MKVDRNRAAEALAWSSQLLGAAYVTLALLAAANAALAYHGLPYVADTLSPRTTGILACILAGIALLSRAPSLLEWAMSAVVGLWILSPFVSVYGETGVVERQLVPFALTGIGLVLGAAMAGPRVTRWLLFYLGSLWAATSMAMGVMALRNPGGALASTLEPGERYGQWLEALGLPIPAEGFPALIGLSLHRNLLGMFLAIVVVMQFRHVINRRSLGWLRTTGLAIVGPVLTLTALIWTLSRTSIAAALIGIVASLLPVERISRRLAMVLVGLATAALALAPLRLITQSDAGAAVNTLAWREAVWQGYINDYPMLLDPFGVGPNAARPNGAAHAHNQGLESLVVGGWLGIAMLALFALMAVFVAVGVAGRDSRLTYATLIAAAAVCGFEAIWSPGFARGSPAWVITPALTYLIALVASGAGLLPRGLDAASDDSAISGGTSPIVNEASREQGVRYDGASTDLWRAVERRPGGVDNE